MRAKRDGREVFMLGAFVGVLGGVIVGSIAAWGVGDRVGELLRRLGDKLFDEKESIRFELLGQ